MINRLSIFIKFMLSGGPAFAVALGMNFILVEHFHMAKPVAYSFILLFQLFINFVILKLFVFKSNRRLFNLSEMSTFFSGVILLRVFDWALYTFFVNFIGVYFMYAQVGNMILFSAFRFLFAEKILAKNQ